MKTHKDQPHSDLFKSERMEREEAEARTRRLAAEYEAGKTNKKSFEMRIGHTHRVLRVAPCKTPGTFALYATDLTTDQIGNDQAQVADIPEDGLLGTLTVHSAKKFEFDGPGVFTGEELEGLATQLVLLPQFMG